MMVEAIGEPAMLEQLAEECAELSKAALKLARIERKENPTPVTFKDAKTSLVEEYTDVVQCAMELDLKIDLQQVMEKQQRFLERLEASGRKEEHYDV